MGRGRPWDTPIQEGLSRPGPYFRGRRGPDQPPGGVGWLGSAPPASLLNYLGGLVWVFLLQMEAPVGSLAESCTARRQVAELTPRIGWGPSWGRMGSGLPHVVAEMGEGLAFGGGPRGQGRGEVCRVRACCACVGERLVLGLIQQVSAGLGSWLPGERLPLGSGHGPADTPAPGAHQKSRGAQIMDKQ